MELALRIKKIKSGWSLYEITWLVSSTAIILSLSVMWEDTLLATISSITGIISVVLCAKGKISYIYFGIVQCSTYGYIAYNYGLYGESMLNLAVFLPANIITIFLWKRNLKNDEEKINGESVYVKKLSKQQWLILVPSIVIASLVYGTVLDLLNASQVGLDSFIVVLSIFAQFLLTFRYTEQWLIWIVVNALTIVLWIIALKGGSGADYGILVMWCAFLINSIYGYINWSKVAKGDKHE